MALATLKPRLATVNTLRAPVLESKAGAMPRVRGRAWMEARRRVALAHDYRCAGCGCVWVPHRDQIDHKMPLEQGGSNDDSNLQPLCSDCHERKTSAEAAARAAG
jgi:5-methylcytosine-specific restriction endonuclease McrA